jgi:hypothetical protein
MGADEDDLVRPLPAYDLANDIGAGRVLAHGDIDLQPDAHRTQSHKACQLVGVWWGDGGGRQVCAVSLAGAAALVGEAVVVGADGADDAGAGAAGLGQGGAETSAADRHAIAGPIHGGDGGLVDEDDAAGDVFGRCGLKGGEAFKPDKLALKAALRR